MFSAGWNVHISTNLNMCRYCHQLINCIVCLVLKYEITVVTGDLWSAGSEANVYMTIYGERGDTGVRLLHKNKNGKGHKFQKGQVIPSWFVFIMSSIVKVKK